MTISTTTVSGNFDDVTYSYISSAGVEGSHSRENRDSI